MPYNKNLAINITAKNTNFKFYVKENIKIFQGFFVHTCTSKLINAQVVSDDRRLIIHPKCNHISSQP